MIEPQDLERIIAAGAAAPSADNSQPWLYRRHERGIDLYIDPRRADSPSNAGCVLSDLALGAVVENISLEAQRLGHRSEIEYFPAPESPLWIGRISWTDGEAVQADPLAAAIPRRHTERRFPLKGPIADITIRSLMEQAAHYVGTALLVLDDDGRRRTGLRLLRRAESLRFRYRPLHRELFGHVRWDAGWKDSCNEGLPPGSLAVEPPMRPLFKGLRHWRLMTAVNRIGAARLLGFRAAYLPARLAPILCLLTVKNVDRTAMVQAGRALQRVWLQATLAGLAVQPFAAGGLFTLGKMELGDGFRHDVLPLKAMMGSLCPPGHQGLLFLRLGYPPASPPVRAGRRAAAEFAA